MPSYPPPDAAPNRAKTTKLPEGTALFRVHPARFGGGEFNPTSPLPRAAAGASTAPADAILPVRRPEPTSRHSRGLLAQPAVRCRGVRQLPGAALVGRRLAELRTTEPLRLVIAARRGSFAARAGLWLVHCDASEYGDTREWGAAIMRWNPWAAGLAWRPRHDDDGLADLHLRRPVPEPSNVVRTIALDRGRGGLNCARH